MVHRQLFLSEELRAVELKEAKCAPGKVAIERRTFRPIVSSYEERSSD